MLVNCAAYQDGRRIADLPVEEISDYLKRSDCFVWVALADPSVEELEVMRREFDLHELAVEDTKVGHQRPKVEEYGDCLFVVLHTVEFDDQRELSVGEIDIFAGPNYVLSVRNNAKKGFKSVRERCEREPKLLKSGPAFVLYAIMDAVVDRYFPIVDILESQLEEIESLIFARSTSARFNIEEVYALKRKLMVMSHAIGPLTELTNKLHGGRVPQLCYTMQDYFRDVSDHVIRLNRSVDSVREMSTTAIQVNLSLITLSETEVTKKLASYGALFAVPTAIAGIYGMNFKHMPELDWVWGYPFAVSLIVVCNFFLWRRFRKAGWL